MQYNLLQTARVENFVRRLLGVRNGGIIPTVAPELGVSLNLPDLGDGAALLGYIPFGFGQYQAAGGAGTYSYVLIANRTPGQLVGVRLTGATSAAAGSGWLVVFDAIGPAPATLLPADQVNWLDTRRVHAAFPLNTSGVSIGSGTAAAIAPGLGASGYGAAFFPMTANARVATPQVVLRPGTAAAFGMATANTDLWVAGECWIRDLIQDELVI